MKPITNQQIKIIKVACKELRIDDATYRGILAQRWPGCVDESGKASCTRLNYLEATDLITYLKERGASIGRGRSRRPRLHVAGTATPAQIDKIVMLEHLIVWRKSGGHLGMRQRMLKTTELKNITQDKACSYIETLKKIIAAQPEPF